MDVTDALHGASCSHSRAYLLFIESLKQSIIKQCTFFADPWDITVKPGGKFIQSNTFFPEMGINAELYSYDKHQTFYVYTFGNAPYCK